MALGVTDLGATHLGDNVTPCDRGSTEGTQQSMPTSQELTAVVSSDISTSSYNSSGQSRLGKPSMYVLGSENFLCISLEDIHGCMRLSGSHQLQGIAE